MENKTKLKYNKDQKFKKLRLRELKNEINRINYSNRYA